MGIFSEVFGAKPSPRVLVASHDGGTHELPADKIPFVATLEYCNIAETQNFRLAEWDVLVCFGDLPGLPYGSPAINKIIIGGRSVGVVNDAAEGESDRRILIQCQMSSVGREIHVPADMRASIADLTRRDIVPLLSSGENRVLSHSSGGVKQPSASSSYLDPFAYDGDRQVLAGSIECADGSTHWYIPEGADAGAWLRVALETWAQWNPQRYTAVGTWSDPRRWMSSEQLTVLTERDRIESEFAARQEEFNAAIGSLDNRATEAAVATSRDCGRLLTAQGDDLVDAVAEALREIGFTVHDMDKTAEKGVKLEDLQVMGPDAFIGLAEVRGYAGGAKTSDLLRLGQFTNRFSLRHGKRPSAVWYIVNQFIGRDPSQREIPLSSRPEEVEAFCEDSGAVIDTRILFDLVTDVRDGAISAEDAVALLCKSHSVIEYTPRRTYRHGA